MKIEMLIQAKSSIPEVPPSDWTALLKQKLQLRKDYLFRRRNEEIEISDSRFTGSPMHRFNPLPGGHEANRSVLKQFWQTANARDWGAFAALLHPELLYVVPQTRERVRGREGFVDFFQTWPGTWEAKVETLMADERQGVTVINFVGESETATGISFFEFADGLIHRITEYWPEPYEPPQRFSAFVERYDAPSFPNSGTS